MDVEERISLVKQVGEEIITLEELRQLLEANAHPVAYDGFEPSGTDVHIAQGLLRAINVNKMTKAGCRFKMLAADWHAFANNKLGGDLGKIQKVGSYMVEMWKACDMNLENVEFIRSSDIVNDSEYWKSVLNIARENTVTRITRCAQIMGRSEKETLSAAQIIYPCMQAADIFHLKAEITQLGMDQRKVNVLAREIGPKLGFWKPVVVSHHMLMGLGEPKIDVSDPVERAIALKMSKSKPETAIFMNDSEEDIKRKIEKAYCPLGVVENNPILEYCRYILFEKFKTMKVERPQKWGGDLELVSYNELEKVFADKKLHPTDLKKSVYLYLNRLLEPIRKKLTSNKKAQELLCEIEKFEVTR